MFNYETIQVIDEKPVLRVNLNRPEKANAMNAQMNRELDDVITHVRQNHDYRVIVFTGNGRVFSAGADMKELSGLLKDNPNDTTWIREDQLQRHEFLRKFDTLDQITVAAINGPMRGAGMALAMVCDFRIMAEEADGGLPEIERGLFFSGGGTPRLVNLVGPLKAKELIMLGETFTAEEAEKMGLVNKVVPLEELETATDELVSKLTAKSFAPLRISKKIVNAAVPAIDPLLYYDAELQEAVMTAGGTADQMAGFEKAKK
ncbi:hypothetical protein AV656_08105 [Bhargavaea cecembensis]|uniref:Enoyl-CoA hydratase n=1 Tax=Bhargavaea cecembensis TaxID=394098 RepID=A0A165H5Q1_9BACL|nr:enoyl-CoA hydratase/isomerase family protein [Bhargavaea cecembensis]KZE38854.1 hypothetical protein AV656_08105 [Bhargavaea cecembensis]